MTKIILAAICISLFTEQSSDKFYRLSSSYPFGSIHGIVAKRISIVGPGAGLGPRRNECRLQSLDKRFDVTQFFLLPSFTTGLIPPETEAGRYSRLLPVGFLERAAPTSPLRGPPYSLLSFAAPAV